MIIKNIKFIGVLATIALFSACQKDFLDKKPSTGIVQPTTLEEFQSLLDNTNINNVTAGLAVVSADEHLFHSDAVWLSARTATERNVYIWAKDLYEGETNDDWNKPYTAIFYANCVLAGLKNVPVNSTNANQWNKIKGWALFVRAYAYYELLCNFSPVFDETASSSDLGVPLRTNPSVGEVLPRAAVSENYRLIFEDLHSASQLLDKNLPTNRNRPSKVAAFALLSKIYLGRREYNKAEEYADSCLRLYDKLIDYNTLNKASAAPFSVVHDEMIYYKYATNRSSYSASGTYVQISPELIALYPANDLRLSIFFNKQTNGSYLIKRGYSGTVLYPFVGLATDEIYLIKAECLARRQQTLAAVDVLNALLVKRWNPAATVPAVPFTGLLAASAKDALNLILLERRKELVWRGTRWEDLKRLNKEGANITLKREINGQTYMLLPNSAKYVFPIPDEEIGLSGIQQNKRE